MDKMETIKYALIGCGRISPNHIMAVQNNKEIELRAVCDLNKDNARNLLSVCGLAEQDINIYTDYHEMLAKERPDLTAVATESGKHAAIALDVLDAHSHVIVEKPMALSLKDADQMIQKAEQKNLKLCICHQNRFNKSVQQIRKALETGLFGRLLHGTAHILWNRTKDYYDQARWRGTWKMDGGALMNQCIHNIDLLCWMMGNEIEEVFAYTDNLNHPYIEAEDLGLALVRFKNGAYGMIEGTTNTYGKNLEETLYLFGEQGMVKAGGRSVNVLEEYRFAHIEEEQSDRIKRECAENPPNIYGFGHTPLYRDMVKAVRTGCTPYVDGLAGRRALELVLAIYQSAKTGQPVQLPLKSGATIDFKGRFQK